MGIAREEGRLALSFFPVYLCGLSAVVDKLFYEILKGVCSPRLILQFRDPVFVPGVNSQKLLLNPKNLLLRHPYEALPKIRLKKLLCLIPNQRMGAKLGDFFVCKQLLPRGSLTDCVRVRLECPCAPMRSVI